MKKTGGKDDVYNFIVDYDDIEVTDILDIHIYLMRKNEILENYSNLLSKYLFQQ